MYMTWSPSFYTVVTIEFYHRIETRIGIFGEIGQWQVLYNGGAERGKEGEKVVDYYN